MIAILHRYTGFVIYRSDLEDVRAAVLQAVKKNVSLAYANLQSANLQHANLQSANLQHADLWYADLRDANLQHANLQSANLQHADLRDANLRDANLRSANLRYAYLHDDTRFPTGETFAEYKSKTLPALVTAGGRSLAEVAAAWDCHTWENCPMHVAFGADSVDECPILLQPRVEQFVQLFDAGLLPRPDVTEAVPTGGEVR